MHEIIVISGKGGTGKTSLSGAFARISRDKIICDLDVDAPDLHILLAPQIIAREKFISGNEAIINRDKCTSCGICLEMCRYDAISDTNGEYLVQPLRCEGCKVCVSFCPEEAIDFPPRYCGDWYVSSTRFGTMVHAQLFPGAENSGRLVALLRQKAREKAKEEGRDLILCDGAPGIGCPVISSLSGTDLAAIVTEPTPSGLHDLQRVAELCSHFKIKVAVIINKFDLNLEQTDRIEDFCRSNGYELTGKLPHDNMVTEAMVERKVITEINGSRMDSMVREIWDKILSMLGKLES
jgi:MinD superfamily P-loop ATPase